MCLFFSLRCLRDVISLCKLSPQFSCLLRGLDTCESWRIGVSKKFIIFSKFYIIFSAIWIKTYIIGQFMMYFVRF
jgi:hypothetical protein